MTDRPRRPPVWLLKAIGLVVRTLLRSPLHRFLSAKLMLLEYSGRTSGRMYTIPVGYFDRDEGEVVAFTSRGWWRNLRDGATVRMLVRGRWYESTPSVAETLDERAALLDVVVRRVGPRAVRRLYLPLPTDRRPTPEELRWALDGIAAVRFAPRSTG